MQSVVATQNAAGAIVEQSPFAWSARRVGVVARHVDFAKCIVINREQASSVLGVPRMNTLDQWLDQAQV